MPFAVINTEEELEAFIASLALPKPTADLIRQKVHSAWKVSGGASPVVPPAKRDAAPVKQ